MPSLPNPNSLSIIPTRLASLLIDNINLFKITFIFICWISQQPPSNYKLAIKNQELKIRSKIKSRNNQPTENKIDI